MSVKEEYGVCKCCGKTLMSETDKHFFYWFCGGLQKQNQCHNYGSENEPLDCRLKNCSKKREILQSIIRTKILDIITKDGMCATPLPSKVSSSEILKSLKPIFDELIVYEINLKGENILLIYKK